MCQDEPCNLFKDFDKRPSKSFESSCFLHDKKLIKGCLKIFVTFGRIWISDTKMQCVQNNQWRRHSFVALSWGFFPLVPVKAADVKQQQKNPSYFTFWSSQAFCNCCLNSHTSQGLAEEKVLFLMSLADPMPDYTQSRAPLSPCSANYAEPQ